MLIPYMRARYMPLLFGFKNYLNNGVARLCDSLIFVDHESPAYLELKK